MPARSKVAMLPDELRTELERRMAERSFSGYQELAEWLQAKGYPISDDSVQRHGAKLQRKLELLDLAGHQARALTQAGYDADIASDAMVRLLQVQLFSLLFEAEQLELNDIVRLTRTVVQLNRQRRTKEAGPQQKPAASRPAATTGRNMFTEQDSQEIRVSPGKAFAPTITPAASGHPGRSAVPAGQSHQFRRTGKTRRACSAAGAPSVAGAARDEGSVTTY